MANSEQKTLKDWQNESVGQTPPPPVAEVDPVVPEVPEEVPKEVKVEVTQTSPVGETPTVKVETTQILPVTEKPAEATAVSTSTTVPAKTSVDINTLNAEFTPTWRNKTTKDFDTTAKSKNNFRTFMVYLGYALILIGLSIASYAAWEYFIKNNVKKIDFTDTSTDDEDSETPTVTQKNEEITFYVVEIGAAGNRQVKSNETETECGDILVPVVEDHLYQSSSLDDLGDVTDLAKLKTPLDTLLALTDQNFDEENNLVTSIAGQDLKVTKVWKLNEEYIVELEGTVTPIGVCDGERITGQLEETAEAALPGESITFKLNESEEDYDNIRDSK